MSYEDKLFGVRERVSKAKSERDSIEGQLKQLNITLKEKFNCRGLDDVRLKMKKYDKEIISLEDSIDKDLDLIELQLEKIEKKQ